MFATTKQTCELLEKNAYVVWITQYMSSLAQLVKGVGVHPDRKMNSKVCLLQPSEPVNC
jgi:hypothetical protein